MRRKTDKRRQIENESKRAREQESKREREKGARDVLQSLRWTG